METGTLSIKRLGAVIGTAIAISGYTAFATAFQTPLPQGAGVDEILVRLQTGLMNSLNAIIPAVLSALIGFFTRADKSLPLLSIAKVDVKQ